MIDQLLIQQEEAEALTSKRSVRRWNTGADEFGPHVLNLAVLLLGVRKCTASDIGPMPFELRAWILK